MQWSNSLRGCVKKLATCFFCQQQTLSSDINAVAGPREGGRFTQIQIWSKSAKTLQGHTCVNLSTFCAQHETCAVAGSLVVFKPNKAFVLLQNFCWRVNQCVVFVRVLLNRMDPWINSCTYASSSEVSSYLTFSLLSSGSSDEFQTQEVSFALGTNNGCHDDVGVSDVFGSTTDN